MPFELLRRAPDVEGEGLGAVDAADRLILDESAGLCAPEPGPVRSPSSVTRTEPSPSVRLTTAPPGCARTRTPSWANELHANAAALGLAEQVSSGPLNAALVTGARVVLMRLPRARWTPCAISPD